MSLERIKGNWANFTEKKPDEQSLIISRSVPPPGEPQEIVDRRTCLGYYCAEDDDQWTGEWMYIPT